MALNVIEEKVDMINNRISPIKDEYIEKYFKEKKLNLKVTLDYKEAFEGVKFIIISTSTNYDDLYPSRIIVGEKCKRAEEFVNLFDIILVNRLDKEIEKYKDKIYTRD